MITQFKEYIDKIQDEDIRNFVYECLKVTPEYFWKIPASSSGKHHPEFALGEKGLQRHTVAAMYLCLELARTYNLSSEEIDICLAAIALHDTCKYGTANECGSHDKYNLDVHSYMPRIYFGCNKSLKDCINKLEDNGKFNKIMRGIECHMGSIGLGEWNPMNLKPSNNIETVIHLSDYIASRKNISIDIF